MADAKSNTSPVATPEDRLARLLTTCRRMEQNLNRLCCTLNIVDDAIPDRDNDGVTLSGLIQMVLAHQTDEHAEFVQEIRIAAGEVA
ncbi:hypothetical protein [Bombella apis]|uniref:DUF1484 family protein n=1 Tax=Bombella apis TaxID=1785988 RepID=A0ABR9MMT9_9PROT|nr:hypothetical protein [Bombella apis]MBE1723171.1 hypothetical protein [Bombella apis]MBR9730978.1 hypothetical protein [Bombella apis]